MGDNKVNPNNESRREVANPNRVILDRGGRLLAPNRINGSSFQKLLDETSQNTDLSYVYNPGESTASATREAARPALSQQERYGRDKDDFERRLSDREIDREEGKGNSTSEFGKPLAKEANRRVVARSSVSERKNQGQRDGSGQKEGGSGQGKKGRGFLLSFDPLKTARRGKIGESIKAQFTLESAIPSSQGTTTQKSKMPTLLTKALLDQMVQYARLVTKTDGDKEFDLQLHEQVFKGLKLRISMTGGKMDVTFSTPSEEVQGLFLAQKGDLRKALVEKGIDVRSINVIMV